MTSSGSTMKDAEASGLIASCMIIVPNCDSFVLPPLYEALGYLDDAVGVQGAIGNDLIWPGHDHGWRSKE